MKPSLYNYIFHTDNYSYWMNGITGAYLRLSTKLGSKLESLIINPEEIKIGSPKLFDILTKGGFVISKDQNEIQDIQGKYNERVFNKNYFLIIMPTLDCNFKCNYCVQSHIPSQMSANTIERIKSHIQYMVEKEKIHSLTIEWFGGEPFLYFNEVIKPITEFAKEICEKNYTPFYNASTTNGSLITESISKQLSHLSFVRFQITLDGDKVLHDSIKYNNDITSAFDTTLANIKNIIEHNPNITIHLRINYTDQTFKSNLVQDICNRLPIKLRTNIIITLKKVWQHTSDKARFSSYLDILNQFRAKGFNVTWLDVITDFMPCYVNKKYYACINYNGGVVKCTNSEILYSINSPGHIKENGSIEWDNDFDLKNQEPSFENPTCLKCKRLPICMGNCPRNHMQSDKFQCKWPALDIDLEKAIIAYIDDRYHHIDYK